jgi:hypothetical protein
MTSACRMTGRSMHSAVSSLAPVVPPLRSLSRFDAASTLLGACFVLLVRDRAGVVCEAWIGVDQSCGFNRMPPGMHLQWGGDHHLW